MFSVDVVDAIADPVRRQILNLLRDGALTAGTIAAAFPGISRPGVSRHLRVLREQALVVDQVTGRERHYRLDPGPLAEVERWLGTLRAATGRSAVAPAELGAALGSALDALDTEVRRTRKERAGTPARPADTPRRTA